MSLGRTIQPGYDNLLCSTAVIERINCGFARQVYARYLDLKYGVNACIEDEYDKYWIKKSMFALDLIYDPDQCKVAECCAPEDAVAELYVYHPNNCQAPINSSVVVSYPAFAGCEEPEDAEAEIVYNR